MTPSLIKTAILSFLLLLLLASCATYRPPSPAGDNRNGPGKELYDAGRADLLKEDYAQAIDRFHTLVALHPKSDFAPQARMELAYSYYKSGDALSTIAVAERFIRDYPNHSSVDYLYYLRGLAAYEQSIAFLEQLPETENPAAPPLAQLTVQYFNILVERFPGSKYSEDALSRLSHLKNALARIEVRWAKRALAREDYASAALHARAVMEKYPDSAHAREATALADMSSRALNLAAPATVTPLENEATAEPDTPPPASDHQPPSQGDMPTQKIPQPEDDDQTVLVTGAGPHREDWLLAQDPNAFTLQLLATGKHQALLAFIERHGLQEQAAYFSSEREGLRLYTLVYGSYKDRRAAQDAAAALPEEVRALRPWIRSLGGVIAKIRANQPTAAKH